MNHTQEHINSMTCTGGRPGVNPIGRMMVEFDTGKFGPEKISAACLSVASCAGRTWSGTQCVNGTHGGDFAFSGCRCDGACPAGYYCGGDDPFWPDGMEGVPGAQAYVYGVRGEKYYA